jgi:hypothetical protein
MNVALNNAQNLLKHYEAANGKVQVEFVAYGPGLHMVRSDTSPVKERLSGLLEITRRSCFQAAATDG